MLGGIDTVCFDKTGTLTRNNVSVSHIHQDGLTIALNGNQGTYALAPNSPIFRLFAENVLANNSAQYL